MKKEESPKSFAISFYNFDTRSMDQYQTNNDASFTGNELWLFIQLSLILYSLSRKEISISNYIWNGKSIFISLYIVNNSEYIQQIIKA